MDLITVFYIR